MEVCDIVPDFIEEHDTTHVPTLSPVPDDKESLPEDSQSLKASRAGTEVSGYVKLPQPTEVQQVTNKRKASNQQIKTRPGRKKAKLTKYARKAAQNGNRANAANATNSVAEKSPGKSPDGSRAGETTATSATSTVSLDPAKRTKTKAKKQKSSDQGKACTTKVCGICTEDVPSPSGFPAAKDIPRFCKHAQDYCKVCIKRSLENDIETKRSLKIGCPHCERDWGRSYLANFIDEEALRSYDRSLQESDPNFRICLNNDCDGGAIYTGKRRRILCSQYQFAMCFECREP